MRPGPCGYFRSMKYLPIILLLCVGGCSGAGKHKANDLVSEYVKRKSNDPASYQPVSFGPASSVPVGVLLGSTMTSSSPKALTDPMPGDAIIHHEYRGKNSFGALVLESDDFIVDSISGTVMTLAEKRATIAREAFPNLEITTSAEAQATRLERESDSIADSQ